MSDELPPRLAELIAGERDAPTGDRRRVRAQLSASLGITAASSAAAASTIATKLVILAVTVGAIGGGAALVAQHADSTKTAEAAVQPARVARSVPDRAVPVASVAVEAPAIRVVAPAAASARVAAPVVAVPAAAPVAAPAAAPVAAPAAAPVAVAVAAPAAATVSAAATARAAASVAVAATAFAAASDPAPATTPRAAVTTSQPNLAERVPVVAPARDQHALLALAWSALSRGDNRAALALLDEDATHHPSAALDEERDALRVETLRRLGQTANAHRAAREFLARFPTSVHRALVAQALSKESP